MRDGSKYRIRLIGYPFFGTKELDWVKKLHIGLELAAWEKFPIGPDGYGPVYMVYTDDYYQAIQRNRPKVFDYFSREKKFFGDIGNLGGLTSYGIPVKSCELIEELA